MIRINSEDEFKKYCVQIFSNPLLNMVIRVYIDCGGVFIETVDANHYLVSGVSAEYEYSCDRFNN